MENYDLTDTLKKNGDSGSASVLFIMSILGLAVAFFTLALPEAGEWLMAENCTAANCVMDGDNDDNGIKGELHNDAFVTEAGAAESSSIPVASSMSIADEHLQIAESFNAELDRNAQHATVRQTGLIVYVEPRQHNTPSAYLANAAYALP